MCIDQEKFNQIVSQRTKGLHMKRLIKYKSILNGLLSRNILLNITYFRICMIHACYILPTGRYNSLLDSIYFIVL
jgi:hypothetical protein